MLQHKATTDNDVQCYQVCSERWRAQLRTPFAMSGLEVRSLSPSAQARKGLSQNQMRVHTYGARNNPICKNMQFVCEKMRVHSTPPVTRARRGRINSAAHATLPSNKNAADSTRQSRASRAAGATPRESHRPAEGSDNAGSGHGHRVT